MLIRLFLLIALIGLAFPASAQDYEAVAAKAAECRQRLTDIGLLGKTWELPPWECQEPVARTFKQVLAADEAFRADSDTDREMGRHNPACQPFVDIGWECSYLIRGLFTDFLAVYGKVLFPTNQYVDYPPKDDEWPLNRYIGSGDQNKVLVEVLRRNIELLKDGDLTAEEVVHHWR